MTARSNSKSVINRPARHFRAQESDVKAAHQPRPSTPMPVSTSQLRKGEASYRSPYSMSKVSSKTHSQARIVESKKIETYKTRVDRAEPKCIQNEERLDKLMFTPVGLWVKSNTEKAKCATNCIGNENRDQKLKINMKHQAIDPVPNLSDVKNCGVRVPSPRKISNQKFEYFSARTQARNHK